MSFVPAEPHQRSFFGVPSEVCICTHEYTRVHTMTSEQFCYWLQGFMECHNPDIIYKNQVNMIKDHLQLVFKKETPNREVRSVSIEDAKEKIDYAYIPLSC